MGVSGGFFESSSKENTNVNEAFMHLARTVFERKMKDEESTIGMNRGDAAGGGGGSGGSGGSGGGVALADGSSGKRANKCC